MARRKLAGPRSPVCARYETKPPANESPAPVGSTAFAAEGWRPEHAGLVEEQRARVAPLDHDLARAEVADRGRRLDQAGASREQPGLLVVEQQHVDGAQHLLQRVELAGDPEVHGVAGDELGLAHLREHLELQVGVDVRQEDIGRIGVASTGAWDGRSRRR